MMPHFREIGVLGVYLPPILVYALVAGLLFAALRRLLSYAGYERFVWHPPLADLAVYVLLLAAVAAVAPLFMP
jgi:hypothetical protein